MEKRKLPFTIYQIYIYIYIYIFKGNTKIFQEALIELRISNELIILEFSMAHYRKSLRKLTTEKVLENYNYFKNGIYVCLLWLA